MHRFEQMAIFAKVVELNSFTNAARDMGLSKSTVSTQISKMEDRLGVLLLQRSTRRLNLTSAGASYYDYCARMVELADQANTEIVHVQEKPTGILRITAPMNFGAMALSPLAVAFLKRHTSLNIDLMLTDHIVNLIEEGVDLAFRFGAMRDTSLIARHVADVRHYICATPGYLKAHSGPANPSDLLGHDCLSHETHQSWKLVRDGETKSHHIKSRFIVNNMRGLKSAALAGLGIVRLPGYMCQYDLRTGRLVELLDDWHEPPMKCHAVYPNKRHLPPKVRGFLDFVLEAMK